MRKFAYTLLGTVAAATMAPAANAALFVVDLTSAPTVISPSANQFASDLNALGLTLLSTASFGITTNGIITFEFLGSESGFADTFFTAGGLSLTENTKNVINNFGSPIVIGSQTFNTPGGLPGGIDVSFRNNGNSVISTPGTTGFGLFLPTGTGTGTFTSNADDNHDDMIIRATISAVPEPATWAFMLVGFGAVGYSLRRRPSYKLAQAV